MKKVILFGATSSIGSNLIDCLTNYDIYCVSRGELKDVRSNVNHIQYDLEDSNWQFPVKKFDYCVFCAESTMVNLVPSTLEIDHMIFISSASKVLKCDSKIRNDIALVEALSMAENFVKYNYSSYSIIRPTWVFDGCGDKISTMYIQLARRTKVFPFIIKPNGKRNPIDPITVAHVLSTIIKEKRLQANEAFNIGGCKTYSYEILVNKILTSHGLYFLPIFMPLVFYKLVLRVIHKFNRHNNIHSYMFEHMKIDLNVDNSLLPESLQRVIQIYSTKFWDSYEKI